MKTIEKIEKAAQKVKVEFPVFTRKAPDAIMADVWRIKAQLNAEAGYSVDKIVQRARQCATQQSTKH
jgi:endo-alpha-1,4-polygalactosaminidase (GH114 family)